MLATLLLVAEAQHLLGRLEYLAQQLALPFVPDAGTDRPDVDDGQQQQQAQPLQALHPPDEVGDRLGIGEIALEGGRRHEEVPAHQPGDSFRLRFVQPAARAELGRALGPQTGTERATCRERGWTYG